VPEWLEHIIMLRYYKNCKSWKIIKFNCPSVYVTSYLNVVLAPFSLIELEYRAGISKFKKTKSFALCNAV